MQPTRPSRGPGSFSPLRPPSPAPTLSSPSAALVAATAASSSSRLTSASPTKDRPSRAVPTPPARPLRESPSPSDDVIPIREARLSAMPSPLNITRARQAPHLQHHQQQDGLSLTIPTTSTHAPSPIASPLVHNNFSRPTHVTAAMAATNTTRHHAATTTASGAAGLNVSAGETLRVVSPLTLPASRGSSTGNGVGGGGGTTSPVSSFKPPGHSRKHSQSAGLFDVSLPSTNGGGSLSQVINAQQQQQPQHSQQSPSSRPMVKTPPLHTQGSHTPREMSASQIAAQTAVLHHQQAIQGQGGSTKLTTQQQQHLQQAQIMQQQQQHSYQGHQQQQQQQHTQQYTHTPTLQQQHFFQNQQQQHPHALQHVRQRSQTFPAHGEPNETHATTTANKRNSGVGPLAPPALSLTEASAPRESGFGSQTYHNGLLGSHTSAAQTAANVVFSRSGAPLSPKLISPHSPQEQQQQQDYLQKQQHAPLPPPPPPPPVPEKKAEKTKVKLFSRPSKIATKGDLKDKSLPSPSKMGISSALASLQRANFSTTNLDSSAQNSFYNLGNSSAATIRASDGGLGLGLVGTGSSVTLGGGVSGSGVSPSVPGTSSGNTPSLMEKESSGKDGREGKESKDGKEGREGKEKKHHFLSRQKHKIKDKDDFHLPLSSAASNSRPTDPNAPRSLYNFSLPPNSPGPASATFKSMSGLDLRHGGRALRDKKKDKEDKSAAINIGGAGNVDYVRSASIEIGGMGGGGVGGGAGSSAQGDWPGPGSFGSGGAGLLNDSAFDATKYGSSNLSYDDAWPYLKAKLQVIFEGEDLRIPVELLNRVVVMHIQYCIQRRSPNIILEDLRDLLTTGFASLDRTLRKTSEDRLIPALVELWLFTFTSILPYMQAVFLPLDLEFAGTGTLLTADQARDFWGGVPATSTSASSSGPLSTSASSSSDAKPTSSASTAIVTPVSAVLDVRRLVLVSYRDIVILPRYDTLKPIFSRLSLDFLPQPHAGMAMTRAAPMTMTSQTKPIPIQQRPGRSNSSLTTGGHSYGSFGSSLQQQQQQQQYHIFSMSPGAESAAGGGSVRPGTATSYEPSIGCHPSATTLNNSGNGGSGGGSGNDSASASGSRSRAISNVSFASSNEPRPSFSSTMSGGDRERGGGSGASSTPAMLTSAKGGASLLGSVREQNVEDSKQVTEMVGRMLQCMSVLAGVGAASDGQGAMNGLASSDGINGDEGNCRVEELSRLLKLNWLGRGRTGRNRRGMVGGRVKRGAGVAVGQGPSRPGGGTGPSNLFSGLSAA